MADNKLPTIGKILEMDSKIRKELDKLPKFKSTEDAQEFVDALEELLRLGATKEELQSLINQNKEEGSIE